MKMLVSLCCAMFAMNCWAQDVVVPQVTTASPGAYAQPLQLDTDRYNREQAKRQGRQRSTGRQGASAQPTQAEIDAVMARLAPEYRRRVQRDGERSALVWLRQAAFEAGRDAASQRRR